MTKFFNRFRKNIAARLATALRKSQPLQLGLSEILSQAKPSAPVFDKVLWLEELLRWIKRAHGDGQSQPAVRIKFLFNFLQQNPEWEKNFALTLIQIFRETKCTLLCLQTSASRGNGVFGFFAEVIDRVTERLLPRPRDRARSGDLLQLCSQAVNEREDATWIEALPVELIEQLLTILHKHDGGSAVFEKQRRSVCDALVILGIHISSLGIGAEVRNRLEEHALADSSFLVLNRTIERFVEQALDAGVSGEQVSATALDLRDRVIRCQVDIRAVYRQLEDSGVSVSLVFRLEALGALLSRVERLSALVASSGRLEQILRSQYLFAELILANVENESLVEHVRSSFRMLSRKIVERNGHSGEHYQVRSRAEYWAVLKSGMGGGIIVALMTFAKLLFSQAQLAPILQGLGQWVIYAAGFICMQLLGWTLATKLPSFTASHLARGLRNMRKRGDVEEFAEDVAGFFRSQFAALVGNIAALIPVVVVLDLAINAIFKGHVASPSYAHHTLESLNPLLSGCLPLGALTGVELWLSSLVGGAFENWIAFHQISEAVANDARLKRLIGPTRTLRFSKWLLGNASGLGANVSLGFLFGFMPIIGLVLGVNLESRHVTISSASAIFSFSTLYESGLTPLKIAEVLAGLTVVGLANITVSFSLAFLVASRACRIKGTWRKYLASTVRRQIARNPVLFLLPFKSRKAEIGTELP